MMNLFGAVQTCPQFLVLPYTALLTAKSKSASFNTTKGSFPPNYITFFFKYLPAFSAIIEPDFVLPVKLTPATDGCFNIWSII